MDKEKNKYELIKFIDGEFSLDVKVNPKEETVWLTQKQMALLFNVSIDNISLHIKNILYEEELDYSVVEESSITAKDGKKYKTKLYNLDMIISVGYRVKSKRGILFRRWANSVLKQYLLNGQVINTDRCLAHSDNLIQMNNAIKSINKRLESVEMKLDSLTSIDYFKDKLFYNGELFEGYSFVKNLFKKAINRIIIIDSYLDYSVLEMMNDCNVDITIYIASHTPISNREISLFQNSHNLNVIRTNNYHDRFIVIDDELYTVGSSIKDIGKKISQITKLESISINDLLNQ